MEERKPQVRTSSISFNIFTELFSFEHTPKINIIIKVNPNLIFTVTSTKLSVKLYFPKSLVKFTHKHLKLLMAIIINRVVLGGLFLILSSKFI